MHFQGTFLIIRHAQSANNALPEHKRVCDPALTKIGVQQAQLLADRLANLPIRHLYCSGFLRSLETMVPLAKSLRLKPFIHARLYEVGGCYSGYQTGRLRGESGLGRSALKKSYRDWQLDEAIHELGWHHQRQPETDQEAMLRAVEVADWLRNLPADPSCQADAAVEDLRAMIIHADFKVMLLEALLGPDRRLRHEPANTSVSRLRCVGEKWELVDYNNVDHLEADLITI